MHDSQPDCLRTPLPCSMAAPRPLAASECPRPCRRPTAHDTPRSLVSPENGHWKGASGRFYRVAWSHNREIINAPCIFSRTATHQMRKPRNLSLLTALTGSKDRYARAMYFCTQRPEALDARRQRIRGSSDAAWTALTPVFRLSASSVLRAKKNVLLGALLVMSFVVATIIVRLASVLIRHRREQRAER
jgi:hypothetical protein